MCQGYYIQWLDHDDLLDHDKIRSQIEAIAGCQSEKILLSGAWAKFRHPASKARFVPTALWSDLPKAEWLIRKMEQNLYMASASWLVSRQLTETAGPWDTRLLSDDDGEYFCRVLMVSDGVKFVPQARAYWRSSGSRSLSYIGNSDKKREAEWISMKLHIGYLRSLEDTERSRAACVKFLQNWMIFFYPERLDIDAEAAEIAKGLARRRITDPAPLMEIFMDQSIVWLASRQVCSAASAKFQMGHSKTVGQGLFPSRQPGIGVDTGR